MNTPLFCNVQRINQNVSAKVYLELAHHMSQCMTNIIKCVQPAKTQICLCISPLIRAFANPPIHIAAILIRLYKCGPSVGFVMHWLWYVFLQLGQFHQICRFSGPLFGGSWDQLSTCSCVSSDLVGMTSHLNLK